MKPAGQELQVAGHFGTRQWPAQNQGASMGVTEFIEGHEFIPLAAEQEGFGGTAGRGPGLHVGKEERRRVYVQDERSQIAHRDGQNHQRAAGTGVQAEVRKRYLARCNGPRDSLSRDRFFHWEASVRPSLRRMRIEPSRSTRLASAYRNSRDNQIITQRTSARSAAVSWPRARIPWAVRMSGDTAKSLPSPIRSCRQFAICAVLTLAIAAS